MGAYIGLKSEPSRVALAVLLAAACLSGCGLPFRRKAKLPQPVPPVPTVSAPANTGPLEPPTKELGYPKLPDAPPKRKPPVIPPSAEPQEPQAEPDEAQPDKKDRAHRPPASGKPAVTEVPAPAEPAPAPARQAEAPKLGPILDDGQKRAYNSAIDAALANAQRNLAAARSRGNMNVRQREMMQQAETFARQAQEVRQADPAAAQSLAERALQLSQELLGSR